MIPQGCISAIEPESPRSDRVAIYVDGVRQLSIHRRALDALGLEPGATVDVEELLERAAEAEQRAAMDAGVALLAGRDRVAKRLGERLRARGFAAEVAGAVVERLRELGHVDDRRYAAELVRARMAQRPAGRRALQAELRRRGIEAETIEQVLDECLADVDEVAVAVELIQRRLPRLSTLDARTARSRLMSLLKRRGFDYEVIQEAVARAMPETDTDEDVAPSGT